MTVRVQGACVAALVTPVVLATALVAWIAAGERLGGAPLAAIPPANSAEAAAMGAAAEMLRLLRSGNDPNRVSPIRPELISSAVLRATTLEAAVWSRQVQLIELLDREGAIVGADARRHLACLALDIGVDDTAEYLWPDAASQCEDGSALERVLERTRTMHDE
jgi:hypothetical protein